MTTSDARKRMQDHINAMHARLDIAMTGAWPHPPTEPTQERTMTSPTQRRHDELVALLTEIRDRLPERVEARVAPFDPDVIAANLEAIKHEVETPMREHGECCDPAPADVDPDEERSYHEGYHDGVSVAGSVARKAEADLGDMTRQRDEWQARHAALRAAGRALTAEWHARFMALPDATKRHADVLSDCTTRLDDILARDDERGKAQDDRELFGEPGANAIERGCGEDFRRRFVDTAPDTVTLRRVDAERLVAQWVDRGFHESDDGPDPTYLRVRAALGWGDDSE